MKKKRASEHVCIALLLLAGGCAAVFAEGEVSAESVAAVSQEASVNPVNALLAAALMVMAGIAVFVYRHKFRH